MDLTLAQLVLDWVTANLLSIIVGGIIVGVIAAGIRKFARLAKV
jgi:hypothetical protein